MTTVAVYDFLVCPAIHDWLNECEKVASDIGLDEGSPPTFVSSNTLQLMI